MRPERAMVGMLVKAALVIVVLCLFYIAMTTKEKPVPQPAGRAALIQRVLDVLRRGFNIQSPYLSEEELREKARRYMK